MGNGSTMNPGSREKPAQPAPKVSSIELALTWASDQRLRLQLLVSCSGTGPAEAKPDMLGVWLCMISTHVVRVQRPCLHLLLRCRAAGCSTTVRPRLPCRTSQSAWSPSKQHRVRLHLLVSCSGAGPHHGLLNVQWICK